MKLHLLTIGEPKLPFARSGWDEYCGRLGRYHQLRTTHLGDKYANNGDYILKKALPGYLVALTVGGPQWTSHQLSAFLDERAMLGQEVCFAIGGPDGLPEAVIAAADRQWGLSELTFPHDLAMVVVAEALYRASTISAGHPYHH